MIPRIFISSTIADLHYLRDGLRDAVEDLSYFAVMSEHGEVGYLNPTSAAESCYGSVRQCQIVVLIIGKRYGSTGKDGHSITHSEFLAAKEAHVPIITFVEPEVLNYKDVFDADPRAVMWDSFSRMDNARKTFELLSEVRASEAYNATVAFASVNDAKKKLKLQIADFVGSKLSETIPSVTQQVADVLAEIKTMRNYLVHAPGTAQPSEAETRRYLVITRFLLNDNCAGYRKLLEQVFGDLDVAIDAINGCSNLNEVFSRASYSCDVVPDAELRSHSSMFDRPDLPEDERPIAGTFGTEGGYIIYANKRIEMSKSLFKRYDELQHALAVKAKNI